MVGGLPTDAMHDILEGVLHYEMKEMMKNFIKIEGFLTVDELNRRISDFIAIVQTHYYEVKNILTVTQYIKIVKN